MIEQTISVERMEQAVDLFGSFDENIKIIEHELGVSVVSPGFGAEDLRRGGKRPLRGKGHPGAAVPGGPEGDHHRTERALYHQPGPGGK